MPRLTETQRLGLDTLYTLIHKNAGLRFDQIMDLMEDLYGHFTEADIRRMLEETDYKGHTHAVYSHIWNEPVWVTGRRK